MKFLSFFKKALLVTGALSCAASATAAPLPDKVAQRPANQFRSYFRPAGHFSCVVPRFLGMEQGNGASYYGTVDLVSGTTQPIYRGTVYSNDSEYEWQTGAIRQGVLYIPQMYYTADGMVTQTPSIRWRAVELATGKELPSIQFGSSTAAMSAFLYSMTYNQDEDAFYGLALDPNTWTGGFVVKVDCKKEKWTPETIFNAGPAQGDFMTNIIYNPAEKTYYGMKDNGIFYNIDVDLKQTIPVKQYDDFNEEWCFLPYQQSVASCYSPLDHAYFMVFENPNMDAYELFSIDSESYETYWLSTISPTAFFSSLHCLDEYAPDGAPAITGTPTVDFETFYNSGSFSVAVPSLTYDGGQLPANVTLHVLLDDNEICSVEAAPGSTVKRDFDAATGLHTLRVFCSNDAGKGPESLLKFHVGYDAPLAPKNARLANDVLTWTAPDLSHGENNGYFQPEDLWYDVFIDGVKQNEAPVTECEYTLDSSNTGNDRVTVYVTANSHGISSAHSNEISRVLGKGLDLPVLLKPTYEEALRFETLNVGNNYDYFKYDSKTYQRPAFYIMTENYASMPDDWLFMPPVCLDDPNALYELAVGYVNAYMRSDHLDNLDIFIGSDPTPEAMTIPLYSHTARAQATPVNLQVNFAVPHSGRWYIGFHSKPGDKTIYRGVCLYDFSVKRTQGSDMAPGDPEELNLYAHPKGELVAIAEMKLPTKSITGKTLDPESEITVTIASSIDSGIVSGKPGEAVKVTANVANDGFNDIVITPSSAEGKGMMRFYKPYVGYDRPNPPTLKSYEVTPDNLGVHMVWEPSTGGLNGGYVDPEDVYYAIYTQTVTSSTKEIECGQDLEATYRVEPGYQHRVDVGPVAYTDMGISVGGTFVTEYLGSPYEVPMVEEWPGGSFNCYQWNSDTSKEYQNVEFKHASQPSEAGVNALFSNGGGLYAYSMSGSNVAAAGQLNAPKATTIDVKNPSLMITYWDCPKSASFEIWARSSSNQTAHKIASVTPSGNPQGQWAVANIPFPEELQEQGWVQCNIRTRLTSEQVLLLDNYMILQNVDYDFMVSALEAPYSAFVGETALVNVTCTNSGAEPSKAHLLVELLGDNHWLIGTQEFSIGRTNPSDIYQCVAEFPIDEDYYRYENIDVRATVTMEGDQNATNNSRRTSFIVRDHSLPMVRDLKAERHENGQDVILTWSEPDATVKSPDSFETSVPFTLTKKIGQWENLDLDGQLEFRINGVPFDGDDQPAAWVVYDAKEKNTMGNTRLSPRSGSKMLLARSVSYNDGEAPSRNFDWLISPPVKGGTEVSFWMNIIDTQYPEWVNIWVTDKEDGKTDMEGIDLNDKDVAPTQCGDWYRYQICKKSGGESWELIKFTLPDSAKRFAFVYSSFGDYAAMIDDVTFTPEQPQMHEISGYNIYRAYNGEMPELVAINVPVPGYTHVTGNDHAATYYVTTNIEDHDTLISSALSNPAMLQGTGVAMAGSDIFLAGAKNHIFVCGAVGETLRVYTLEGKTVANVAISEGRQRVPVAPGIYVATVGNQTAKLIVR